LSGEELEEDQQQASAAEDGDSEDEGGSKLDPFDQHFAGIDEKSVAAAGKDIAENGWINSKEKFGKAGKCQIYYPKTRRLPVPRADVVSLSSLNLKKKLVNPAEPVLQSLNSEESSLIPHLFGYEDVLFGARTVANGQKLRDLTCLHVLNHVLKTRDRVLKNSARLQKEDADPNAEYRDQGFTRPKVLFLLPTRQSCFQMVKAMVEILQPEQQENRKRFEGSYERQDDQVPDDRPDDFRELFEGNDDDMFRLGVKFTRKTIKFFSQFYNSDIIFASPLGLRKGIEGVE
jgi:U3 small nucleolar RNA-associated protein 25